MDESKRALELKARFKQEFDRTLEQLQETYPRHSRVKKSPTLTEDVFKIVIDLVLLARLKEIQMDTTKLTFKEFHRKYVPNLPILYRFDFTCDEFKKIIDDSYLKQRDKEIAYKFFVEKKNTNEVHAELEENGKVGDKKTVNNNLEAINDALLHRACIFNKENK